MSLLVHAYQTVDRWLRWVLYNLAWLQQHHQRPLTLPWPVSGHLWASYPYGYILYLYRQGGEGSVGWLAQGTVMMLLGLVLVALFLVLLIWILYQRLVADALMVVVFTFAPLAVAALALPAARRQGMLWVQTYVAFSLYAPLTAGVLQVMDKLVFYFDGQSGFDTPLIHAVLALVCVGVITRVPWLANRVTGGGIEMSAFGVPRLGQVAKMVPLLFA